MQKGDFYFFCVIIFVNYTFSTYIDNKQTRIQPGGKKIKPACNSIPIDRACSNLAAASRGYKRTRRRRFAATYRRDIRVLQAWTFPGSRDAVMMAEIHPESPRVTRILCRRLYRDLHDARALPRFFRRRTMRIDILHDLFSGECRLYVDQRARDNAQAAMNGFIISLAAE